MKTSFVMVLNIMAKFASSRESKETLLILERAFINKSMTREDVLKHLETLKDPSVRFERSQYPN